MKYVFEKKTQKILYLWIILKAVFVWVHAKVGGASCAVKQDKVESSSILHGVSELISWWKIHSVLRCATDS